MHQRNGGGPGVTLPSCIHVGIYVDYSDIRGLRRNVSRGRQTGRREFAAFRNKVASTDGTSNTVYSTPRREGWMLLVASCIYVCFMSACILHLRRCHVWWLSSVLSLSPFPPFLSIRASAAFRLFPFSFVSPLPPPYSATRSATVLAFLDISQTRVPPRGH